MVGHDYWKSVCLSGVRFVPRHSSPHRKGSRLAIPYLLSKKANPCEAAAAAAAAGAVRDLVRFSIFKIEDVSGRGPVSLSGELPGARPPPPPCLLDTLFDVLVVVEVVLDAEEDVDLDTLLLFLASDWCLTKEGFGICLTEALAGDLVTAILLEAGRLVMETVLVLDEPSLPELKVFLVVPEVGVVVEVAAPVLGSLVMVTSGVGGDMLGVLGVAEGRQVFVGDFEFVVLVTAVEEEEVVGCLPLVSGVCGAALLVGERSMGAGSEGLGSVFTMAMFSSLMHAAVWLRVIRFLMAVTSGVASPYVAM